MRAERRSFLGDPVRDRFTWIGAQAIEAAAAFADLDLSAMPDRMGVRICYGVAEASAYPLGRVVGCIRHDHAATGLPKRTPSRPSKARPRPAPGRTGRTRRRR